MIKVISNVLRNDKHVAKAVRSITFFVQNVLLFSLLSFASLVGLIILNTETHCPTKDVVLESYLKLACVCLFLLTSGLALITAASGMKVVGKRVTKAAKKIEKKVLRSTLVSSVVASGLDHVKQSTTEEKPTCTCSACVVANIVKSTESK